MERVERNKIVVVCGLGKTSNIGRGFSKYCGALDYDAFLNKDILHRILYKKLKSKKKSKRKGSR